MLLLQLFGLSFSLSHLLVQLVHLLVIVLVLAAHALKSGILLFLYPLHSLYICTHGLYLSLFLLKLILESVNVFKPVGLFEDSPHLLYLLLVLFILLRAFLDLDVLVLERRIRLQFCLDLSTALVLKTTNLRVHLGDNFKQLRFQLLVHLKHTLYRVRWFCLTG